MAGDGNVRKAVGVEVAGRSGNAHRRRELKRTGDVAFPICPEEYAFPAGHEREAFPAVPVHGLEEARRRELLLQLRLEAILLGGVQQLFRQSLRHFRFAGDVKTFCAAPVNGRCGRLFLAACEVVESVAIEVSGGDVIRRDLEVDELRPLESDLALRIDAHDSEMRHGEGKGHLP